MTDREKKIREEIASSVERILEDGGTEKLLHFIREGGELNAILATVLVQARDWEADSDAMIEEFLELLPIPTWVPFVEGFARKKMDAALPQMALNPVLRRLLVDEGGPDDTDLYAYLQRSADEGQT